MIITRKYNVNRCVECPYFTSTMDGPECTKLPFPAYVFPEGRTKIHQRCPFKKRRTK